jgi:hypothetical protein
MDAESRAAGTHRFFAIGPSHHAHAERQLEREFRKMRSRLPMDAAQIDQYVTMLISGLANQLYNIPLDFIINGRLFERYPWLHDALYVGLDAEQAEGALPVKDKRLQTQIAPTIYRCSLTMNAAYALFMDDLLTPVGAYAALHSSTGVLPAARRLYQLFLASSNAPGAEFDLIDAWAQELGLREWYTWRYETDTGLAGAGVSDDDSGDDSDDRSDVSGVNEFLSQPAVRMACTFHMLGALQRFAKMERSRIYQIAAEIAVLGMDGIKYADPDMKYRLRLLPGEEFTGLQLLCIEYVGFKQTEPGLDLDLPFDGPYLMALDLLEKGM